MSFVRLLPLMLLVSTLAFADSDKNFKIPLKPEKCSPALEETRRNLEGGCILSDN